jgi:hypothetical protein
MIVGNGSIAGSGYKDCSSCQKFDRGTFVCEFYGHGTLVDKVYFNCGKHIQR